MKGNLARASQVWSESMDIGYDIVNACNDAKAKDVAVLDVSKLIDLTDLFIVASGRSDRQVQGIANRVIDALAARGIEPESVEGLEVGHWVVIDCGEIIVHVFYEPLRSHYDIEGLWVRAGRLTLKKPSRRKGSVRRDEHSLQLA